MYNEFDEYLQGFFTDDYWYDDAHDFAEEMLEKFNISDWEKLMSDLLMKSVDWQKKYVYCIDNGVNCKYAIQSIFLLLNIEDKELLEMCVDSLRCIIGEENSAMILNNDSLMQKMEKLYLESSKPVRLIIEDFKRKLNNFKSYRE